MYEMTACDSMSLKCDTVVVQVRGLLLHIPHTIHAHLIHRLILRIRSYLFFFFFSSRRRHTRFDCDWSSDVCSSDLISKGSLRDGVMLLLATDAVAAWLLKQHEEGRPLWKWLYRKLSTPESFAAMIAYGRKNALRNDDFTLVRVIHHDLPVEAKES